MSSLFSSYLCLNKTERHFFLTRLIETCPPGDLYVIQQALLQRGHSFFDPVRYLPVELWISILSYCSDDDLIRIAKVSRMWRKSISTAEPLWKERWRLLVYRCNQDQWRVKVDHPVFPNAYFELRNQFQKWKKMQFTHVTSLDPTGRISGESYQSCYIDAMVLVDSNEYLYLVVKLNRDMLGLVIFQTKRNEIHQNWIRNYLSIEKRVSCLSALQQTLLVGTFGLKALVFDFSQGFSQNPIELQGHFGYIQCCTLNHSWFVTGSSDLSIYFFKRNGDTQPSHRIDLSLFPLQLVFQKQELLVLTESQLVKIKNMEPIEKEAIPNNNYNQMTNQNSLVGVWNRSFLYFPFLSSTILSFPDGIEQVQVWNERVVYVLDGCSHLQRWEKDEKDSFICVASQRQSERMPLSDFILYEKYLIIAEKQRGLIKIASVE